MDARREALLSEPLSGEHYRRCRGVRPLIQRMLVDLATTRAAAGVPGVEGRATAPNQPSQLVRVAALACAPSPGRRRAPPPQRSREVANLPRWLDSLREAILLCQWRKVHAADGGARCARKMRDVPRAGLLAAGMLRRPHRRGPQPRDRAAAAAACECGPAGPSLFPPPSTLPSPLVLRG
eukprot:scaffold469_cov391-Prasinococcus_capsulatus_cf.AAC.1